MHFVVAAVDVRLEGFEPVSDRTYDITPDGQRFLLIKESAPENTNDTFDDLTQIIVVQNWFAELERLVPIP